jgi:mannose-1-phosphate guanylyltransferase
MDIVPVILSGGVGSRLWPLSRQSHPKPFVAIPGAGGTPAGNAGMLAAAVGGASGCITVTGKELRFLARDAYVDAGVAGLRHIYLLEPEGRGSAAAIALACLHAAREFGGEPGKTVLAVIPADNFVGDIAAMADAVRAAAALARKGGIALVCVPARTPDHGLGYVETDGDRVLSFREKPDSAEAGRMIASGRHFWHSGILCVDPVAMIGRMRRHAPATLAAAEAALARAALAREGNEIALTIAEDAFRAAPQLSIERAVLEKCDVLGCVVAASRWSDLGSWRAIAEGLATDAAGNAVSGNAVLKEASSCVVHAGDRLVALVGVRNLTVVDTPDALLIADRGAGEEVSHVFEKLRAAGHEAAVLHRTVHRPWGAYTVLEEGSGYKIKRIVVKPGGRLSLQSHRHRSEHWVVVAGEALVTNNGEVLRLATNESTFIPKGHRHRLENPGSVALAIIEVQSGDYLGEDDIERHEDHYGRT